MSLHQREWLGKDRMDHAGTVLCLEHSSLLRSRAVRRFIRTVDVVAIFEPFGARLEGRYHPAGMDKAIRRWSRHLEGVSVRRLSFCDQFEDMIQAGEEAVRFLEHEGQCALKETPAYHALVRLLKSDLVLLALKKGLANYVKDRILFCRIVTGLASGPDRHVIVAPAYHDTFAILQRYLHPYQERISIPRELECAALRRERMRQFGCLILALAGLFLRANGHALRSLSPLRLKHVRPKTIEWAKQIAYGFDPKKPGRDDILEDEDHFQPSRFLYVYTHWRFPVDVHRWRKLLAAKGARFVDLWCLRMPAGFYAMRKIPVSWERVKWCFKGLRDPSSSKVCRLAHTLIEAFVEAELFMQYYRPKGYVFTDDYLPGHIIRTLVFNRYGCKTIGLHHGAYASLGLNPYIAYTYADTFCAYGPAYFDWIWMGTWSHNRRQAIIGVERNDSTYQAMHNEARRAEFRTKYADSKVLLWCPTVHIPTNASMLNRPELLEGYCRALISFQMVHRNWTVIVRCRPEHRPVFFELLQKMGNPEQIVSEDEFTTYELIAYADGVLAANLSTVGIEAICAGHEKVMFLNYWGTWPHPFQRYSTTLIVFDPKDLAGRLEGWARGDSGHDPTALTAFRHDFDVGFDGRARWRFKAEMRRLAGLEPSVPERC